MMVVMSSVPAAAEDVNDASWESMFDNMETEEEEEQKEQEEQKERQLGEQQRQEQHVQKQQLEEQQQRGQQRQSQLEEQQEQQQQKVQEQEGEQVQQMQGQEQQGKQQQPDEELAQQKQGQQQHQQKGQVQQQQGQEEQMDLEHQEGQDQQGRAPEEEEQEQQQQQQPLGVRFAAAFKTNVMYSFSALSKAWTEEAESDSWYSFSGHSLYRPFNALTQALNSRGGRDDILFVPYALKNQKAAKTAVSVSFVTAFNVGHADMTMDKEMLLELAAVEDINFHQVQPPLQTSIKEVWPYFKELDANFVFRNSSAGTQLALISSKALLSSTDTTTDADLATVGYQAVLVIEPLGTKDKRSKKNKGLHYCLVSHQLDVVGPKWKELVNKGLATFELMEL
jgi:hypothetical protein